MFKGGMAGLMKQAQQMQEKMQKMQEELANAEVTGQSGAGLVSVVMTGRHDVKRVTLDDSLMQEDKDILEDLIAAAGYPDLEQHRRIHQGFVRWIRQVREEFTYRTRYQLGSEILGYLRDWLRNHILGEDQLYRPFIHEEENV